MTTNNLHTRGKFGILLVWVSCHSYQDQHSLIYLLDYSWHLKSVISWVRTTTWLYPDQIAFILHFFQVGQSWTTNFCNGLPADILGSTTSTCESTWFSLVSDWGFGFGSKVCFCQNLESYMDIVWWHCVFLICLGSSLFSLLLLR